MESNVINSFYNADNHTSSCFGKEVKLHNNKKLNSSIRKNPKCYECRYKYPRMQSKRTTINDVDDIKQNWFSWKGSCTQRSVKEINIKRKKYDLFQNISCPALSLSKLTCNTNAQAILPGVVGQYCFEYCLKDTQ